MYVALFWLQTILQLLLMIWLVRVYKTTGLWAAAALFIPQAGLVWDNLIVAAGGLIGLGPLLEALSWPRFWIHWVFGTFLIIACGAILRLANFKWAQAKWAMASFCILTTALIIYDLPHFFNDTLHPVCEKGLVRYSTVATPDKFCFPDQVASPRGSPPIPSIITCFIVIFTGLALWVRRKFPWMFLGGLLMLISATPPLMRVKLDNFGEVLIAGGCIWALAHFSRGRVRGPLARTT